MPGSLCAAMFPAIIGSQFPGVMYLSQSLKFRKAIQVPWSLALLYVIQMRYRTAGISAWCTVWSW